MFFHRCQQLSNFSCYLAIIKFYIAEGLQERSETSLQLNMLFAAPHACIADLFVDRLKHFD